MPNYNRDILYWKINADYSYTVVFTNGHKAERNNNGQYEAGIENGNLREVTKEELALII